MNRYFFFTILTAGVGLPLLSCSNDDELQQQAVQYEIRFGSSVGSPLQTRSFDADNLLNGDTVHVWADMVNATDGQQTEYFRAWSLEADGDGGLTPMNDNKLFPASNKLNFYAMVGNFGLDDNGNPVINPAISEEDDKMTLPTTGIVHTVLDNQSDATNFYKSDLLYAVVKNQEPISQAVVLPFQHMLSRIQVVLVAGNGMTADDLTSATVKLLNQKLQVIFSPDSAKDASVRANLSGMISIPQVAAQGDIQMKTEAVSKLTDVTASVYADAIVVPKQAFATNTALIEVDYLDRQTYYRVPADFTIESGRQYRFRLICDRIGETYDLTPITIEDWGTPTSLKVWLDNQTSETTLPSM